MKKYLAIILFVMMSLCSCGQNVGVDSDVSVTASSASATASTEINTSATSSASITTKSAEINKNPPEDANFTVYDSVEIYSGSTLSDLIIETNVDIVEPEILLDTSDLGKKSVEVIYNYDGETYSQTISYEVTDTTEPTVLNSGWNPYVRVGDAFDIDSIIGYADNYDSSPTVSYTGEVDTSEVGAYPITVTVSDSSGNSTSWDMTVFAVNIIPEPSDNNERIDFTDFTEKYNYFDNASFGIDVSAWQTYVDYEAVKSKGVEFVLMRMGYCYSSIYMDDYYYTNMENAVNAGLDVGVYFYTTANTTDMAREQAKWIVDTLDGRELDFPIAFDWENWDNFQKYGISLHELNEIYYAFCDELEKNGYSGMLYSSRNFLYDVWENNINTPVWLAHYVDETNYEGDYSIWQASAYGRISGIDGDVDMNIRFN